MSQSLVLHGGVGWGGGDCLDVLLLGGVSELAASMENAKVVHVLNIPLPEIQGDRIFLCGEVQRVQHFSLGFSNNRNLGRSWEPPIASEVASGVLDDEALGSTLRCGLMV